MRTVRSQSGHTLLEVLVVVGIMVFVGAGVVAVTIGSATCFDNTTTEAFTDCDAVLAMQMIVSDVREAKSINIIADGEGLRIAFPVRTQDGYYDRHDADMANQIDYYLSNESGAPDQSGTWLWRGKNNNDRRAVKKDVAEVAFEQDTSRSVKITIVTENDAASGTKRTELTQRVVYLRNY